MNRLYSCRLPSGRAVAVAFRLCLLGVVWAACQPAAAQNVPRAGGEMPVAPLSPPPLPPPVVPAPPIGQPATTPTGVSFELRGVRFVGATVFTDAELQAVAAPAVGRRVTLADLESVAQRVTEKYRGAGYLLGQAVVPAQEVNQGVVEISVLEGRLGKISIELDPATPISEAQVRAFASRLPVGQPLREDTLTRVMMLISDLPGVRAEAALDAGEAAGTTDLTLTVTPRRAWDLDLDADNFGLQSTSIYRVGFSGRWNSPLKSGDNLDYRLQVGVDGRLAFGRIAYEHPIGDDGWRASIAASAMDYALAADFVSLDANGRATVLEVALTYPMLRSRTQNLFTKLMLQRMWLSESYNAVNLDFDKTITGFSAALNYEGSDAVLGGGYTGAGLTMYFGNLHLDSATLAVDARNTAGGFNVVSYNLSRLQALLGNVQLFAGITGQITDRNLDPVEKIALGGPQAIRAYAPAAIIADEGMVGHAEVRFSPIPELSLQGFYDWGRGRRNKQPEPAFDIDNTVQLAGYGVGVYWGAREGMTVRASVAWPTRDLPGNDQRVPQLYAQIGFSF